MLALPSMLLTVVAGLLGAEAPGQQAVQADRVVAMGNFGADSAYGFEAPVINNSARVLFWSSIPGQPFSGPDTRLTVGDPGLPSRIVAKTGMPAVGMPSDSVYTNNFLPTPVLDSLGRTAFVAQSKDSSNPSPAEQPSGVWAVTTSGALRLIASSGQRAPGTPPGVEFTQFVPIATDQPGGVVFQGELQGPGISSTGRIGIWRYTDATGLQLVARPGTALPGVPAGYELSSNLEGLAVNGAGQVGFTSPMANALGEELEALWRSEPSGGLKLVAKEMDPVPGLPAGYHFDAFGSVALTPSGQALFSATVVSPPSWPSLDSGVWLQSSPNDTQLVAFEGHPVPGSGGSQVFDLINGFSVPNAAGRMALLATLSSADRVQKFGDSLWVGQPDDLQLIAKRGDAAIGMPDGFTFRTLSTPIQNATGDLVVFGTANSPSAPSAFQQGLWHYDQEGTLELILAAGSEFDVDPGELTDLRTIRFIEVRESGLNDNGDLALTLSFTDYSQGVFVISLERIPEPGTWIPLAIGVVTCAVRMRT
jgi:hypothetical protein